MATWISRGMDKFLLEEFGMNPPVTVPETRLVNVGANIYRISHGMKKLHVQKYNLEGNQPWQLISTVDCNPPTPFLRIEVIGVHDDRVFVFLGLFPSARIHEDFVPVYSTRDNEWDIPPYPVIDNEMSRYQMFFCHVGDFMMYHRFDVNVLLQGLSGYNLEDVIPPEDHPIEFRVFHYPTRSWKSLKTTFTPGFRKKDFLLMLTNFESGIFIAEPDGESTFLFVQNSGEELFCHGYRLVLSTKKWSIVHLTGQNPNKIDAAVVVGAFIYAYEGDKSLIFRLDPRQSHWELINASGEKPEVRKRPLLLNAEGKIVLIGGTSIVLEEPMTMLKPLKPPEGEFWFRRMEYNLGCWCDRCLENGLTKEPDPTEEQDSKKKAESRAKAWYNQHLHKCSSELPLTNGLRLELFEPDAISVRGKFVGWKMNAKFLPHTDKFYDLHVLDPAPSLQTLALMTIADADIDASSVPSNFHLNLNTMRVFEPKYRKLRDLTEEERRKLVFGEGGYRRRVVEHLRKFGAYDEDIYDRFKLQRVFERAGKPKSSNSRRASVTLATGQMDVVNPSTQSSYCTLL